MGSKPHSSLYRTIVADPPWEIGGFPPNFGYQNGKAVPYPTLSVDEIAGLPVRELCERDADLYLWTINDYIESAYRVARSWGFTPSVLLTWCKPLHGVGLGGKFLSNTEFILYAVRRLPRLIERRREIARQLREALERTGKERSSIDAHFGTKNVAGHWFTPDGYAVNIPTVQQWEWLRDWLGVPAGSDLDQLVLSENEKKGERLAPPLTRAPGRWFEWPRSAHSVKPEAFLDLVESVSDGPYLELFARRNRLGWDTWGNEALQLAEVVV